jgi:hypothetical protein
MFSMRRLCACVTHYGSGPGLAQLSVPYAAMTAGLIQTGQEWYVTCHDLGYSEPATGSVAREPTPRLTWPYCTTPTMGEARWLTRAASEGFPRVAQLDTAGGLDLPSRLLDGDRSCSRP